jgi:hypothetical protein
MLYENKECGQVAIRKGRHVKSRHPYIATTYYGWEHCGTSFSIGSSLGEISILNDPEAILRFVVSKNAILPKDKLPKDKLPIFTQLLEQIS